MGKIDTNRLVAMSFQKVSAYPHRRRAGRSEVRCDEIAGVYRKRWYAGSWRHGLSVCTVIPSLESSLASQVSAMRGTPRTNRIDQATIDDPRRAETSGKHAEGFGPKGFLHGHSGLAAFIQGFEYRLGRMPWKTKWMP
jgi:hypothetical protein